MNHDMTPTATLKRLTGVTLVVFFACLITGFVLTTYKPLWNDELYTQSASVEPLSYGQMLAGKINEGNASPLFYWIQKGLCDLLRYRLPFTWEHEWFVRDIRSQLILRAAPNISISLTIALIFYFFARFYSRRTGGYALLVVLSSLGVWSYWAEARPYGLWIFLTASQSLIFVRMMRPGDVSDKDRRWLTVVHLLLSLTTVISMAQVLIASSLLWWVKDRKSPSRTSGIGASLLTWGRSHLFLTFLPVAISLFYYVHTPKYKFWFLFTPLQVFMKYAPVDRLVIFGCFLVFLAGYFFIQRRTKSEPTLQPLVNAAGAYTGFLGMTFLSAWAFLGWLILKDKGGAGAFVITARYLVYLDPVETIAVVFFSTVMFRAFKKNRWMRANLMIFLGGLLIIRALKTFMSIYEHSVYIRY